MSRSALFVSPSVGRSSKDAIGSKGFFMEYTISLVIAVALGVYLVYALLRPERF